MSRPNPFRGSFQAAHYSLDLAQPRVMGILNTTPDSFSDGGNCYQSDTLNLDLALRRAEAMLASGAAIVDVGGESTRPGATPVGEQQELDRVVPVVEAIVRKLDVPVSVDTSTAAVIRESAAVGAALINDVRALRKEGALQAAAASGLPVCLMHMRGEPGNMQDAPTYDNVVHEVSVFFDERLRACETAGIESHKIVLDPGFGFGKSLEHNLTLLRELEQFHVFGCPILVGMSRKSMLGQLLGRDLSERLPGSLALALEAAVRGSHIIRVHDVQATCDVLAVHQALKMEKNKQ
ncbi:dihydropteroate synthase [Gilvimarinus sp. SDUM040013]|uniref:Dihydropteroate synthase n=1 Tax=Gilvimarinus gilvus TaxID=3058038 RepID=A0ABU4S0T8_9GAMM|nr:dihydropteroate synthase [Gilvimarinus sp. SDUM040013]MDO3387207.1 dihydropteroate synthase [Gilvimarinus sp. SDUM040013]MDX6850770.1 dihydropteroate synthase [Gilvimarinus sp. SDUM040013]